MKYDIIYPEAGEAKKFQRRKMIKIVRWPFLLAAVACVAVNVVTGGISWSLIALVGLYTIWTLVIAPDLVEYNRISQFIKLIMCACFLLTAVAITISWINATRIISIVCFSGLIGAGILFLTDIRKQKQNMLPMILLIIVSLVYSVIGLIVWRNELHWEFIVTFIIALILMLACVIFLGGDFKREVKKRFHIR